MTPLIERWQYDEAMASTWLIRLLPLLESHLSRAEPVVLATVIRTAGPTYTKTGAQMLITRGGEYAGLLSGGCLEGDLSDRAMNVFETGQACLARYDMRGPDDLLFGLGSGCEGDMDILLQRLDAENGWQPLQRLAAAWRARRCERLLIVTRSAQPGSPPPSSVGFDGPQAAALPVGAGIFLGDGTGAGEPFGLRDADAVTALQRIAAALPDGAGNRLLANVRPGLDVLLVEQSPAPRLLLLGAGPDVQSLAQLIVFLGWSFVVVDHRSHYARAERFPGAQAVLSGGAEAAVQLLRSQGADPFSAAVVMSHHLSSDLAYLRALSASDVPYLGLLGPVSRRDRLLLDLGAAASQLVRRLHAPVGLDLGAASPEAIALSIMAEIHAALADGSLRPLGKTVHGSIHHSSPA